MSLLVECSNCRSRLQLPPGALIIRCAICQAIIHISFGQAWSVLRHTHSNSAYVPLSAVTPSPYNHAPAGQLPHAQGRKRALIVAVSYMHTKRELKGSINDAKYMKYMLINRFKFPESSILMLTEEETDRYKIPTKCNMRIALYWLVQGCQRGDSLVFHFSGHGSQRRDRDGDEVDGYDETLCPVDFETEGMIVDDEINATIVKPLPRGTKLHAIIDACHSGTILDLPFLCGMDRYGKYAWEDHRPRSGMWKGTSGGVAICFNGCDDNQVSADSLALSKITLTGVMTYSFIQAIEGGNATTYGDLLNAIRSSVLHAYSDHLQDRGPLKSLITKFSSGLSLGFRSLS